MNAPQQAPPKPITVDLTQQEISDLIVALEFATDSALGSNKQRWEPIWHALRDKLHQARKGTA